MANQYCPELVKEAPSITDKHTVCYRGRGIQNSPPKRSDMGPPSGPRKGRYAVANCTVLYLGQSVDGVRSELDAWHAEGDPWVQTYKLPTNRVRIADFTGFPEDHLLASVFSIAEECMLQGRGGLESYVFSNMIAEAVAPHFEGMRVRGVRAMGSNQWYKNIVVFRPQGNWWNWLDGDPYPLP